MNIVAAARVRLDGITSLRLTLLALLAMVAWAVLMSAAGVLTYRWWEIAASATIAVILAVTLNLAVARAIRTATDPQSSAITALILVLLVPVGFGHNWWFLFGATAVAIGTKYLVTVDRQHIFNPAALAATAVPLLFPTLHANWWVGTPSMVPAVLGAGGLIVIKTRRFSVALAVVAVALLAAIGYAAVRFHTFTDTLESFRVCIGYTAVLFFAFVMMTDPITLPSGRVARPAYVVVVSVLYAFPFLRQSWFAPTPEQTLCLGNALSFLLRPKYRLELSLKALGRIGADTWWFDFTGASRVTFAPGQYMEWTFPHPHPDGRGQKRYFTIASSPTEADMRIVMRVPERPSSYKRAIAASSPGSRVVAARLAGDFVLPRRPDTPLAFLAGGVGVAPFVSMARYAVDRALRMDVVLLYSNRYSDEILFREAFDAAGSCGWRSVYTLTGQPSAISRTLWTGRIGHIGAAMIEAEIPDYSHRTFFVSGSHRFVGALEPALRHLGVRRSRIRKDYFDGLAEV